LLLSGAATPKALSWLPSENAEACCSPAPARLLADAAADVAASPCTPGTCDAGTPAAQQPPASCAQPSTLDKLCKLASVTPPPYAFAASSPGFAFDVAVDVDLSSPVQCLGAPAGSADEQAGSAGALPSEVALRLRFTRA
jgi:hypothetical protein